MIIESRAYARAGLLGNPSDGYYGRTISVSVRNFGAHVSLYESPELKIEPQPQDMHIYRNIYDLVDSINMHGYYGADRLIKAAIKKIFEYCQEQDSRLENKNFTIRYLSTIPRQVGLAGSSAIITATMKALIQFYRIKITKEFLPSLILATENEELGINAGLQDRVIQVYEGCVYMDFNKNIVDKKGYGKYTSLKKENLPNLYMAYKTELSKVSGLVLNDIRIRYEQKDPLVLETLRRIADIAREGRDAINERDYDRLDKLINENFDLRCKIMNISDENMQMVKIARACGASAKFAGSGGSIIGIYHDDEMLNRLNNDLKEVKARVIRPFIS
jgi:glucuronokinase